MKLVVFGLTMSSSWGNGHATLWRGLAKALGRAGHRFVFFERDVPYYAATRDRTEIEGGRLHLYSSWQETLELARRELADADAALVTSYCPDGVAASDLVLESHTTVRGFYDMDTPITLERAAAGERIEYMPAHGLGDFDVVLSFTGGEALQRLCRVFGARHALPLYGSVDPEVHRPVGPDEHFRGDFSYIGTWAANRQHSVERFFLEPARRMPQRRFVLAGSQYGADFPWQPNLYYVRHLPPSDHPAFLCSSPLTLNVTRAPMAALGYCPSGRLFEAAACGVPCVSDWWPGLEAFLEPGREILVARSSEDAIDAVSRSRDDLARIGRAARERVLAEHTADFRARELVDILDLFARPGALTAEAGSVHGA
ncbi:MAG TPA: glycosyltransferase [Anaeromyxobacteraceae bacterium]|nr:glycosyltransferase [Anaeromyxobacteraceae bacterium]